MSETDNVEVAETTETPVDARPEWLPEKFNTPEDLVTSYSNLESKLGKGEEELRKTITEELHQQKWADRPETAGGYELPESIDEEQAVGNELLNWWADFAFENGYGQDKFAEGVEHYMQAINADTPDLDAEKTKLGENADARIEAVQLWADKFFDESQLAALERMGESAEGIEALEKVISALSASPVNGDAQSGPQANEDELRSMMLDPRYHKQGERDPAFIKRVEDGFAKLYG
jgi:hypothetical protein